MQLVVVTNNETSEDDQPNNNGDGQKEMMCIPRNNNSSAQLNADFHKLCLSGNLMTSTCQHYNECMLQRRRVSRKRLRSEEDASDENNVGRLKCDEEEDYERNDLDEKRGGGGGAAQSTTTKSFSCLTTGENWLCLECGALLCSRYANGHAKLHYEDTKEEGTLLAGAAKNNGGGKSEEGHCIAVSLADLSVWCYECNAYLVDPKLQLLTKHLEEVKFGKKENGGKDNGGNDERMNSGTNGGSLKGAAAADDDMMEEAASRDTLVNNIATKPPPASSSFNKRKSAPRKLPPEQLVTTTVFGEGMNGGGKSNGNESESINSKDDDSRVDDIDSSDEEEDEQQAAMIASLLQSEHGDALRAYLQRYESFDTSNMGQCVPLHMPKPPTFPDEMADFLQSPLCRSIIVLAGAGMSVSSGIPDFRSAGTGLYDTLNAELLTASELEQALIEDDPTLALDKGMFLENPLPMLETKRSFILGTYEKKWKATLAHRFVELLHTKLGKLTRLYTQNIDGLELQTQLPKEKVVPVHGTMGAAACEQCGHEVDFDEFCTKIRTQIKDISGQDVDAPAQSTPIICDACDNPTVKPTIVLFRGSMPKEFHVKAAQDLPECDLLIIMGTSLTVAPANSLVYRIPPTALRMVMNNERVGRRLGIDYSENSIRDVWAHGYTDETCLNLAEKMGWLDDLAGNVDKLPESSANMLRERLAQRQEEKDEGGEMEVA